MNKDNPCTKLYTNGMQQSHSSHVMLPATVSMSTAIIVPMAAPVPAPTATNIWLR